VIREDRLCFASLLAPSARWFIHRRSGTAGFLRSQSLFSFFSFVRWAAPAGPVRCCTNWDKTTPILAFRVDAGSIRENLHLGPRWGVQLTVNRIIPARRGRRRGGRGLACHLGSLVTKRKKKIRRKAGMMKSHLVIRRDPSFFFRVAPTSGSGRNAQLRVVNEIVAAHDSVNKT